MNDAVICSVHSMREILLTEQILTAASGGASRYRPTRLQKDYEMIAIHLDPFPSNKELNSLWADAWGDTDERDFAKVLERSLAHVGAYDRQRLVGFVNVASDGGLHAFILDTCVRPTMRRKGIATMLVKEATNAARDRGAMWLHVDFEAHLASFYRGCGFEPTNAGLLWLGKTSRT